MEIVIRTDAGEAAVGAPSGAGAAPPAGTAKAAATPADLTSSAQAAGAIDAGPARVPEGGAEPLANIAATMPGATMSPGPGGGVTGALAAGSAAALGAEPTPTIVEAEQETAE